MVISCLTIKALQDNKDGTLSPTLAVATGMQLLWILSTFYSEDIYFTTGMARYEGLGYAMLYQLFANCPFLFCLPVRYIVMYK